MYRDDRGIKVYRILQLVADDFYFLDFKSERGKWIAGVFALSLCNRLI